ncbi:ATP-dependent DNA helicase [Puia sp.]|uniref:ATP-dependent DNA helicase n=1 Tax=Puia sp. TaxID=2045100 RepID=UPI002F3F52E4
MCPLLRLLRDKQHRLFHSRPRLVITGEFRQAFDAMENSNRCVYVTGKAGTGKSTLLTWFRQQTKKRLVILAPTGIAALNVDGATIHSFFRLPPSVVEPNHIRRDPERAPLYQRLDTIVIDEISMVRADVMDAIDQTLRLHRNNDTPFGGVQIIFFGDLYQLLPAVTRELDGYFHSRFGGACFFNARVFDRLQLHYFQLQTIFRQKDETFKQLLNAVRENTVTDEQLALLNTRHLPGHVLPPGDLRLTLTTTNKVADAINGERMNGLRGKAHRFTATVGGNADLDKGPADAVLILKKHAQVMLLKNDPDKRWVNGTLGHVTRIGRDKITVRIGKHRYDIERAEWEVRDYRYNPQKQTIEPGTAGTFTQFPLRAAWAMTIHKSQGRTFDQVIIDLGPGAFTHGQTYVALSRCTQLAGIVLQTPIRREDLILDPGVKQFIAAHTKPAA